MKIYAGIGSRRTPENFLDIMATIATKLSTLDYMLRSGRASGADQAFEFGCDMARGVKEIFLPWNSFPKENDHNMPFGEARLLSKRPSYEALEMARDLMGMDHWNRLSEGARLLHARNCHQVLGINLNDPVDILICWAEPEQFSRDNTPKGGTRTAWRLARNNNIPCYNLDSDLDRSKVMDIIHP